MTLEELRNGNAAAWLWDAGRARIVWANNAGVTAFEGQSLFDLIDRPFHKHETGVAAIAMLATSLKAEVTQRVELSFPSVGRKTPFDCNARLHPLADGRNGVLIVEVPKLVVPPPAPIPVPVPAPIVVKVETPRQSFAAYDLLPSPVIVIDGIGKLLWSNALARELMAEPAPSLLGSLTIDASRASEMLERLKTTDLVSSVEHLKGRSGERDVRLTLRRLPATEAPAYCVVMMEDVTERRQVERSLATGTGAVPQHVLKRQMRVVPAEQVPVASEVAAEVIIKPTETAFQELAKEMSDSMKRNGAKPIAPASRPAPSPRAEVPTLVRNSLEASGKAIVVMFEDRLVFATEKVAQLFGKDTPTVVLDDPDMQRRIRMLGGRLEAQISIEDGKNQFRKIDVKRSDMPWHGGPAQQFVFTEAKADGMPEANVIAFPEAVSAPAEIVSVKTKTEAPEAPVEPTPTVAVGHRADTSEHAHVFFNSSDNMRVLLDVSSDGVIIVDDSSLIRYLSAGARALFSGRDQARVGQAVTQLFTPESRRLLTQQISLLRERSDAATRVEKLELNIVRHDGRPMPMFVSLCQLPQAFDGGRNAIVLRDITMVRDLESRIHQLQEQQQDPVAMNNGHFAKLSHELRTPLTGIIGFTEIIRSERFGPVGNEHYKNYINDIHTSGTHLLSLVNDILDLARLEAGKAEMNFTAVDLLESIDYATRLMQEDANKAGIGMRVDVDPQLPRVVADMRALRQVMVNLLSNAVKYTNPGGEVIVSAGLSERGEMVLRVADNGIGMNAEQKAAALEPFKRVETPDRTRAGTGLGLPVAKSLVEANRARFELESAPNAGTRATVIFPTARVLAD